VFGTATATVCTNKTERTLSVKHLIFAKYGRSALLQSSRFKNKKSWLGVFERASLVGVAPLLNDPILYGGLENADLFPMSVRRTVVHSYSKKMLGGQPIKKKEAFEDVLSASADGVWIGRRRRTVEGMLRKQRPKAISAFQQVDHFR
jgi:hypothetical protein